MVKHMILWNIDDKYSVEEKDDIKKNIKTQLEGLFGKIPGLLKIEVTINSLGSSTADLMLNSEFESEEALKNYSVHPLHVEVANTYVRPYTVHRSCLDFIV